MIHFRITKYDPLFRNELGHYTKNDWTSVTDIGKTFEEGFFTQDQYLVTEEAYIKVVMILLRFLHVKNVKISTLEKYHIVSIPVPTSPELLDTYNTLSNNDIISINSVPYIVQLVLRELIWCKLLSPTLKVYFGYDYYMYVSVSRLDTPLITTINELGLFTERINIIPV